MLQFSIACNKPPKSLTPPNCTFTFPNQQEVVWLLRLAFLLRNVFIYNRKKERKNFFFSWFKCYYPPEKGKRRVGKKEGLGSRLAGCARVVRGRVASRLQSPSRPLLARHDSSVAQQERRRGKKRNAWKSRTSQSNPGSLGTQPSVPLPLSEIFRFTL